MNISLLNEIDNQERYTEIRDELDAFGDQSLDNNGTAAVSLHFRLFVLPNSCVFLASLTPSHFFVCFSDAGHCLDIDLSYSGTETESEVSKVCQYR